MHIEILKVEELTYSKVKVNHLYPHGESQLHRYRRYSPTHWCHFLGDNHGWHRVSEVDILEDAFQIWKRKNGSKTETSQSLSF